MPIHTRNRRRSLCAAGVAALLGACSSVSPQSLLNDDGVLFIVQSEEPEAVMEALYEGILDVDALGCIRLEREGEVPGSTVVWRPAFSLEGSGSDFRIRGPSGIVGELGGSFRMGGGHVGRLDGVPLSDPMRAAAEARCPGDYWLVGDIP